MINFFNLFTTILFLVTTLSFLPHFRILGVVVLLPLFFVISLTYYQKGFEPIGIAALCGILTDMFSSYPFGFYLSIYLFGVVLVRFVFAEGMRSLSLWFYLLFSLIILAVYYAAQVAYLYFGPDVVMELENLTPVFFGIGVNLCFAVAVYFFAEWYFEFIKKYEYRLKRK